ncbi:MAG TPA: beta family protein [Candidatus Sulfotelmatobacter sp.]|nr:beta family protein [Candidatus Sulfotelmatobacter sp.]
MTTHVTYVPVLKGKEGEFAALEELRADVRHSIMPLIEVPDVPYDYVNERPARSLDEHVSGIAKRLKECWPHDPLFLDLPWFGEEEGLKDGRVALDAVLGDCRKNSVCVVPVISRRSSADYFAATNRHLRKSDLGTCLRLTVEDFEEDVDLESEVDDLLHKVGSPSPSSVDLILDLEDLGMDDGKAVLIARSVFSMIPKRDDWRRIILIAASFPEDLSDIGADDVTKLPRREWTLWNTLQKRPKALPRRDMIFGDYAIAHPIPKELDPRMMLMSANIRYTTQANWMIMKGRNVRQYGFEQYFDLCKRLTERAEYSGSNFSWGDQFIFDCAAGIKGPGNATTWRKVGTNHHITLVATQLANSSLDS